MVRARDTGADVGDSRFDAAGLWRQAPATGGLFPRFLAPGPFSAGAVAHGVVAGAVAWPALAESQAAVAVAADLLGGHRLCGVCDSAVPDGGHRVRRPAGVAPHPGLCLPLSCHCQQSPPPRGDAGHQLDAGFHGDGDLVLRGLSVPRGVEPGLEHAGAGTPIAAQALIYVRITWRVFWRCSCRWAWRMRWSVDSSR